VKGTEVTGYTFDPATNKRHITGKAEVNGTPGYDYEVDVVDNDEPGRGKDWFSIKLMSRGYEASNLLDGGNIQLHRKPGPCTQ
jgi:hypothetical protein